MSKKDAGRGENSGLIDLDALLRASSPDVLETDAAAAGVAPPAAAPVQRGAPPGVSAATPAAPKLLPPVHTPPPRAVARSAAESLDGISTPAESTAAATAVVAEREVRAHAHAQAKAATATGASGNASRGGRRALVAIAALVAVAGLAVVGYRAARRDASATASAVIAPVVGAARTGVVASLPAAVPGAAEVAGAPAFDPSDLPAAREAEAVPSAVRGGAGAVAPRGVAAARSKEDPGVAAKVSAVVLPDAPARDPSDLGAAMRGAVGARNTTDVATTTKEPTTSARTLRPSPGAVVGAINGVLPSARSCLGPDDPVRTASLTFRSDGSIARVDISGTHATDSCVRGSLAKARIEPFADESFVTKVTVRP